MKKNTKNNRKVYRLAVYGLSASGKTCMLTALAMPRYSHPLGYTGTWQPIDVDRADNEAEQQLLADSNDEMEKAEESLSQGQVPEATAIREGHFIFEY